METLINHPVYFLLSILYIPLSLAMVMLIEVCTGRVGRFMRGSITMLILLVFLLPVFIPLLYLPRYKVRRGATKLAWGNDRTGKILPFIQA